MSQPNPLYRQVGKGETLAHHEELALMSLWLTASVEDSALVVPILHYPTTPGCYFVAWAYHSSVLATTWKQQYFHFLQVSVPTRKEDEITKN